MNLRKIGIKEEELQLIDTDYIFNKIIEESFSNPKEEHTYKGKRNLQKIK